MRVATLRLAVALGSTLCLTSVSLCAQELAVPNAGDALPSKEQALAGQKEYRRRGGVCMNSRVYRPAMQESRLPKDLRDTPVIVPHIRQRFGKIVCYAVDGDSLWAADDQTLFHVRGDGTDVRRFDASDGLPDQTVQSIAVTAGNVWLATLGGLALLDTGTGKIEEVPGISFTIAQFAAGDRDTWLVTDSGTYHLAAGSQTWRKLPDFPGQERLAASVRAGFWWFRWHNKEIQFIPDAFATRDGLYLLHERVLYHYGLDTDRWQTVVRDAWRAMPQGRTVWALCTQGVYRHDPDGAPGRMHKYGEGPAIGLPVAMSATEKAFLLASHGSYDAKAEQFGGFSGGGISRFDVTTGNWQVTDHIDGINVQFVDSLFACDGDVLAGVMLFDKPVQLGAHPGMAHVKRWKPHASGLGLACFREGKWSIVTRENLKTERRWMGPHGVGVHLDSMGPQHIDRMCCTDGRVWGVYRVFPETWYGGYYASGGCLARRDNGRWEPVFDVRTEELALAGEHPPLLGVSRSHGGVYLAEGHLRILGIERVAGRCWVISHGGLYVYDAAKDRFAPVLEQADRLYFRATCAAPAAEAVWFGGDGGTISRLDRKTGRLGLVGVVPGRKIAAISADKGRVTARTVPAEATLPASLRDARLLPAADVLVSDGKQWRAGTEDIPGPKTAYSCRFVGGHADEARRQVNYLWRGKERIAFIEGVFRPKVLAEDATGKKLWIATYAGIAVVPLPTAQ